MLQPGLGGNVKLHLPWPVLVSLTSLPVCQGIDACSALTCSSSYAL